MSRLPVASAEALDELEPLMAIVEQSMGFRPESMRTMARVPGLAEALAQLAGTIWGAAGVDGGLKALVAVMASRAAGCRYCQAHTAHRAVEQFGVDEARLAALWSFEQSDLFTAAECAALRVAAGAAQAPSAVTDEDFADLARHFDEDQIAELVGVIALFGFLNRWNDTLSTDLEETPLAFARTHLAATDWTPGRHGAS